MRRPNAPPSPLAEDGRVEICTLQVNIADLTNLDLDSCLDRISHHYLCLLTTLDDLVIDHHGAQRNRHSGTVCRGPARVLEDARSPAEIECEERRVSLSSTASDEPLRPQRMSYAGPLPSIPKSKGNEWKRRTAPVGMMGLSGMHTPPLSPKTPARRAGSPAALIGAAMLGQAGPTPPSSTAGSPTPFSTTPGRTVGRPVSARFARSNTPSISSPASSPAPSPSSAHKVRPWEKQLSGLSAAPERSDSLETTASAASTISTYSYDVQVVHAAKVSTHEGVLASPILGKAASLKSRPTSLSASTSRLSVPPSKPLDEEEEGEDSFLAYLNPAAGAEELEPILEIIKPTPTGDEKKEAEMLWLVENISGHQFYVPDSDVIAVSEGEHRRLRARENRHFWPVYASQLEFLSLRRRDIRRRHRATLAHSRGGETPSSLLVEFTDRFEYADDSHEPPLPGQHEAALNAAFRSLRKAEGLPAEDVVLSDDGGMVTLRSAEQVAGMLRGGWFECDEEFWEDAKASV
ncbi:hypothetical protein A1Q1_04335 [Trichosporon asahii var. asahii CBS 2479]|uniref:Uncharacterized protein n=1 Tax=Trichosporon asahii var. asahii (strain ATCC 90039 / CBS 2479 / JCM 2466 / KCTC 7840 / NBRC 103889/ NCYC 2677 / UAMH 7654) TaxID=1186058 RepID=J5QEG8_TRIAS|nr:hypothetical protein A1Q1_04335 [Trichosporon asahii var. asahii CBS 2479]EJT46943.1 hypothetical protein A1Q1_04335 [Trichosporon asahii var. asahii CBS 2479]